MLDLTMSYTFDGVTMPGAKLLLDLIDGGDLRGLTNVGELLPDVPGASRGGSSREPSRRDWRGGFRGIRRGSLCDAFHAPPELRAGGCGGVPVPGVTDGVTDVLNAAFIGANVQRHLNVERPTAIEPRG